MVTVKGMVVMVNYLLWELAGATWGGNKWMSPVPCAYGWLYKESYLGITTGYLHTNTALSTFWGDGEIGDGKGGQRATFYTYRRTI